VQQHLFAWLLRNDTFPQLASAQVIRRFFRRQCERQLQVAECTVVQFHFLDRALFLHAFLFVGTVVMNDIAHPQRVFDLVHDRRNDPACHGQGKKDNDAIWGSRVSHTGSLVLSSQDPVCSGRSPREADIEFT
jgi:hypothetical protein